MISGEESLPREKGIGQGGIKEAADRGRSRSQNAGRGRSHSQNEVRSRSYTDPTSSSTKNNKAPPRRIRSKSLTTPATFRKSSKNDDSKQKLGFFQTAKVGYQELCNFIIRPPRCEYCSEALGPEEFVFCGERFVREDFGVVNERGLLVECSIWKKAYEEEDNECGQHWKKDEQGHGQMPSNEGYCDGKKRQRSTIFGPMCLQDPESVRRESLSSAYNEDYAGLHDIGEVDKDDSRDELEQESSWLKNLRRQQFETTAHSYNQGTITRRRDPVVIYLHGNCSGRIEVVSQLGYLLSMGVAVVAFDFSGSGKSEGEFVSLGLHEQGDLQTVIHHLRASGDVSTIALWGRSMGAATAIMYASRDPSISCMILDSSFTDLTRLASEMVENGTKKGVNVPNFVVAVALRIIKRSIKSQAGFSIRHISPISHVNRCWIPAMFVAGENDSFISKRHSERLHAKYAGDKDLVVVDGDHNSPRPESLLQSACSFLRSFMLLDSRSKLVVPLGTDLLNPPWSSPVTLNSMGLGQTIEQARVELDEEHQQLQRRQSQPHALKVSNDDNTFNQGADRPAGLPFPFNRGAVRSRSCIVSSSTAAAEIPPLGCPFPFRQGGGSCTQVASSSMAAEILEACAPPDMSVRQKEIQSSLSKMLGQR